MPDNGPKSLLEAVTTEPTGLQHIGEKLLCFPGVQIAMPQLLQESIRNGIDGPHGVRLISPNTGRSASLFCGASVADVCAVLAYLSGR